jgi:hypothetical protein
MKRIVLFGLGLLFVFGTLASAQTPPGAANPTPGQPLMQGPAFVDLDGDGICDNFANRPANGRAGQGQRRGKGYGPGDGTGRMGAGPKDGTGYGPGTGAGTGNCTGTGPQGGRRGGRR